MFAGGPTATSNPEPFSDFLDFVALGDGEDLLPEIARCLRAAKASRLSRLDTLRSLTATVAGVYVPQLYSPGPGGAVAPTDSAAPPRVLRRVATPLVEAQVGLVPFVETIHDRMTVEIRRGCTRGCRFCQPGMLTRPARDVDPDTVVDTVEKGIRTTGYNEFSLLSLSCSDYLALPSVGLQVCRLHTFMLASIAPVCTTNKLGVHNNSVASCVIYSSQHGAICLKPEAFAVRLLLCIDVFTWFSIVSDCDDVKARGISGLDFVGLEFFLVSTAH